MDATDSQELWHTNPADGSPGGCVTPSVFISYRREDCPGHAGRLFDHLRARFGGASVFMDVTDIEAGVDFVDVLQRAVGSCDVLLAVIGREWLTCTDRNGRRRLDDPNDFIRLEIGIALTRNVRVIPVLVEGAVVPTASELPSDLEGLTRRQAVELRDARWSADVESLAGVLDHVLGPTTAGKESTRHPLRHARWWGLAAAALVAAVVAVVTLVPRGGSPQSAPAAHSVSGTPAAAEQRAPVQTEPPASAASGPEARTNPAPATEQPTRAPASPVPQPAPAPDVPLRREPTDIVPSDPRLSGRPANGGWLGVLLEDAPVDSSGVRMPGAIVLSVKPGGPVAKAGMLPGDLVVEYGGTPVSDVASLVRLAGANAPGDSVLIHVRRRNTARTLQLVVGDRSTAKGNVAVFYAPDVDQNTIEDLVAALQESINDARYVVRTVKTPGAIKGEAEVRYSSPDLSVLAATLARSAGSWLSRAYGHRVAVTPIVDPRVTATGVVVIIPGRTSAPAAPLPDPVVTVVYPTANDARTAEELADFLRTRVSGWKYSVRTEQKTTGPKGGQIEFDNERMGEFARVLARDLAAWIPGNYGRGVVLQPTLGVRIGPDAVVIWLPSR